ncbi:MAG: heme-dependent oxidative N-demethylase family protein [Chromatiales bacterium]
MPAVAFKPDESFRDSYKYNNSSRAIRRFPFPFPEDSYMYSVNIEPHARTAPGTVTEFDFDIDEHYVAECKDRRITLEQDPGRCQVLPHLRDAEWDLVELLMERLSRDYPEYFELTQQGSSWTWKNRPLNIEHSFTFGEPSTLPYGPFEYITRQAQGDFVLIDQRDNQLYMDGGMVTTQADWSLDFDLGMNFVEWHGPVPVAHELGVFERALKFLLNLRYGHPVRRLNWTMTINPRLDTSPEHYHIWGPDRTKVTANNAGDLAHLRVELQTLYRLPRSNAILFVVRCYLINMKELVTIPKWGRRMHRVLKNLHPALVDYKGLTRFRETVVQWLAPYDDGAPTSSGTAPD